MERGAFGATAIWFLREQALWQALLYSYGGILRLGPPKRLIHISYKTGRWLKVAASLNGHWVTVDDGTGYDSDHPGGLWLIGTHPKVTVRKVPCAASPTFAPDCRQLAVTRIEETGKQSVAILDLVTNRWRVLLTDACQPFWSADGRELTLIKEGTDGEFVMTVEARSGQVGYKTSAVVSLAEPFLSPDGRYIATLCAISRPKLGHTIYDRRTGQVIERSFDWPNRLPAELYGWSPNGKWLACNWRVPNPDNAGTWLRDEVGLVSWQPGVCRWVDVGNQVTFSQDSQFLFWLRPNGTLCATTVGPKATRSQKLLTTVEAFAVS